MKRSSDSAKGRGHLHGLNSMQGKRHGSEAADTARTTVSPIQPDAAVRRATHPYPAANHTRALVSSSAESLPFMHDVLPTLVGKRLLTHAPIIGRKELPTCDALNLQRRFA